MGIAAAVWRELHREPQRDGRKVRRAPREHTVCARFPVQYHYNTAMMTCQCVSSALVARHRTGSDSVSAAANRAKIEARTHNTFAQTYLPPPVMSATRLKMIKAIANAHPHVHINDNDSDIDDKDAVTMMAADEVSVCMHTRAHVHCAICRQTARTLSSSRREKHATLRGRITGRNEK